MCYACTRHYCPVTGMVLSCTFPAGKVGLGDISRHRRGLFGRLEDHQVYIGVVHHGYEGHRLALVRLGHLTTCKELFLPEYFVSYGTFLLRAAEAVGKSQAVVVPNKHYEFAFEKLPRRRKHEMALQ